MADDLVTELDGLKVLAIFEAEMLFRAAKAMTARADKDYGRGTSDRHSFGFGVRHIAVEMVVELAIEADPRRDSTRQLHFLAKDGAAPCEEDRGEDDDPVTDLTVDRSEISCGGCIAQLIRDGEW